MSKLFIRSMLVGAAILISAPGVMAQTAGNTGGSDATSGSSGTGAGAGTSGSTNGSTRSSADNDHDYGWIGLAGLLGLAGLMRRNDNHNHDRVTTGTATHR
jgi:hypothetical protein